MWNWGREGRLRRTWPQRLVIAFNVVCILAALTTAGTVALAKRKVSEIPRVDLSGTAFVGTKGLRSADPVNFLVVGADSDDGLAANDPVRKARGNVSGIRSDTIMVVRLEPKTGQAKVLSFPRDLWVDIPGHGKGRINQALEFSPTGKPALLIATLKQDFRIVVNHYVQVDFAGFKRLVGELGGVPIYFDTPVGDGAREGSSGLRVKNPGCTTLDETGALQYVRSRHFYRIIDGERVYDRTSDLARIGRQQDFIKRVLRRAVDQGVRNPVKLANFVDIAVNNITLDQQTKPRDLIALGAAFRNFDPSTLGTYGLPVVDTVHGGAEVLDLLEMKAEPILAQFRGTKSSDRPVEVDPATVTVQVRNGTNKTNQAATATSQLASVGFRTEAPDTSPAVMVTQVRYGPGREAQAALVARHLFARATLVPDARATRITVVTGPDFATVLSKARPAADVPVPTTTTTAATSTTTTVVSSTAVRGSTTTSPAVTTTTGKGFVPDAAPPGVDCG